MSSVTSIHNPEPSRNRAVGMVMVSVFVASCAAVAYLMSQQQRNATSEEKEKQTADTSVHNVVPHVGNRDNLNKAWNDTPTIGMMQGSRGTAAPSNATSAAVTTPVPGGLEPDDPRTCALPTGYLAAIVKAWNAGDKHGLVESEGIIVDMGHPGAGGFYDTNGDGCCDTYCRRVVKGGWWSCIDPNTITSQYEAGKPRGTICSKYGKRTKVQ